PGVVLLVEQPLNERARRRDNVPPPVHQLRDRRQRHASLGGDGRQRRAPRLPGSGEPIPAIPPGGGLADRRLVAWKHCITPSNRPALPRPHVRTALAKSEIFATFGERLWHVILRWASAAVAS